MIFYPRILLHQSIQALKPGKVLVIVGARRVGKTALIKQIAEQYRDEVLFLDGEELTTSEILQSRDSVYYRRLLNEKTLLIIDEAQKVENIGSIAKIMIDHIENLRIILTGSSSFDLVNRSGEPLTGRKLTLQLFPLSQEEFAGRESLLESRNNLEEKLVYGCYPEIWQTRIRNDRLLYLKELTSDYLLKDIFQYNGIRNADKIKNLLRLIALQIGKEVSLDELGRQLGLSKNTVEKYLDLFTKVFVLFRVSGFSRNLRKEISKSSRWYFMDNGIRNVFAANFNLTPQRQDIGQLWENYVLSERVKYLHYHANYAFYYFWRTYDQQEIDWVEDKDGRLSAFEIKWKMGKEKVPAAWKKAYPDADYKVIDQDNYLSWITEPSE